MEMLINPNNAAVIAIGPSITTVKDVMRKKEKLKMCLLVICSSRLFWST